MQYPIKTFFDEFITFDENLSIMIAINSQIIARSAQ